MKRIRLVLCIVLIFILGLTMSTISFATSAISGMNGDNPSMSIPGFDMNWGEDGLNMRWRWNRY